MLEVDGNLYKSEELFNHLLKYIDSEGLDPHKKFTVKEIHEICKLYKKDDGTKMSTGSYHNAIVTMISSQVKQDIQVSRDYFKYVNEKMVHNLNKDRDENVRQLKKYYDEELYLNKKYIKGKINKYSKSIKKAGSNEEDFKHFVNQKNLIHLEGKKVFGKQEEANISVDNYFKFNNKKVYVEIDSGNMAKLLVGQYTLLHRLSKEDEDAIFLVIHYYKGYNAKRTEKNLEYIRKNIFYDKGMKYLAIHIDDFKNEFSKKWLDDNIK